MARDVFISYSVDDKAIADRICSTVEAKGIRCWIAPRDILPGMDWGGSIVDAIAAAKVMVLLLSSNSNNSSQVRREVERAANKEVTIIPFRVENVSLSKSLEYHLSSTQWLDASAPPMEKHLLALAELIDQILTGDYTTREIPKPVPDTGKGPFYAEPPSKTWWSPKLIAGLAVGLIVFIGLIWLWGDNPTRELTAITQNQTSPTSTPGSENNVNVPGNQNQNAPKENTAAQNQNNSAPQNTGGERPVPNITAKTYDQARKILIAAGWQPSKKHVSYGQDPAVSGGNGPTFWKKGYWEVVSCAGTGAAQCLFEFTDPSGRKLIVITEGEEGEKGENYHASVVKYNLKAK